MSGAELESQLDDELAPLGPVPPALPLAPASVLLADGRPAFGAYMGNIPTVDWSGLDPLHRKNSLWRRFHHKRWQYVGIGGADCFIGLAVVDVGWACSAFAYLFDRGEMKVLADFSGMGIPGVSVEVNHHAGEGASSWFKSGADEIRIQRLAGSSRYSVQVALRLGFRLEVELESQAAAPSLSAVIPIKGGVANCTQKSACLRVSGFAEVSGKRYGLDGCSGSLDYTNGLLARDTRWRWASAHSPDIGFNLQVGFNGANENILWLRGHMILLSAANFEFDPKQPLKPWRVYTDDGLLDLTFEPHGARKENKNLLIAASHYIQPIGVFSGTVKASEEAPPTVVSNLLGVTEDHTAVW